MTALRLATENGKRVGRTSRAKRRAAGPAIEAARLRRCLGKIRLEAEAAVAVAEASEELWQKAFVVACGNDVVLTRAMVRAACIDGAVAYKVRGLLRSLEMAEDGSLCG